MYDSVSDNTGDIAIGLALKQLLKSKGYDGVVIDPYSKKDLSSKLVIVGGGELIRDAGDDFYDSFRLAGRHILNGVGVNSKRSLKYLNDYHFVSARSKAEAKLLQPSVKQTVQVVPCVTTNLVSKKYKIKGLEKLTGEKVVGIHLVPDVLKMCPNIIESINNIPHKKVFIPFTHYNYDQSFMKHLPFDKSNALILDSLEPLQLHSVISQMDYVLVSSLHATIFAYSQNIPFISMYQKKTFDYFNDRNLTKFIYKDEATLGTLLEEVDLRPVNMRKLVDKDKKLVIKTIEKYIKIFEDSHIKLSADTSGGTKNEPNKLKLKIKQLEGVVEKRDVLVHYMIYTNMRKQEISSNEYRAVIDKLNKQLNYEINKSTIRHLLNKLKSRAQRIVKKLSRLTSGQKKN